MIHLNEKTLEERLGIPGDYQFKAINSGNFFQANWHRNKLLVLEELLNLTKETKILDLGCGSGNFELRFAKSVKSILAVDYYDECLKFLRKELKRRKILNVSLLKADIRKIEKAGIKGKFDLIVIVDVIEHLKSEEAKKLMEKLRIFLADKGQICLITPNYQSLWRFAEKLLDYLSLLPKMGRIQHLTKYDPKNLKQIFSESGYRLKLLRTFNFLSFILPGQKLATLICKLEIIKNFNFGNMVVTLVDLSREDVFFQI